MYRVGQKNVAISERTMPAILPPNFRSDKMVNRVQTLRINLNISNQAMSAQQEMLFRERDRYSTKFGASSGILYNFRSRKLPDTQINPPQRLAGKKENQKRLVNSALQRTLSIRQRILKILGNKRSRSSVAAHRQEMQAQAEDPVALGSQPAGNKRQKTRD